MARLNLSEKMLDAITEARRITNFEGKRRQMQFVGKLMRLLDPEVLEGIRTALSEQHNGSARENLALHQAEQWRDRQISGDDAGAQWNSNFPQTDTQQLRAPGRQGLQDAKRRDTAAASNELATRSRRDTRER